MLKKSLIAIAVLAIAMPAFAGSLKVHEWQKTCAWVPVDICTIDVLIDVGYYIVIDNQDAIKLTQSEGTNNYSGTYTSDVHSNFDATLSVSITASGDVAIDTLKAEFQNGTEDITAGDDAIEILVTADGVAIEDLTANTSDQKIANMTISVVPTAAP
jgi:hypothetical protein